MNAGKEKVIYQEVQSMPKWSWFIISIVAISLWVMAFLQLVLGMEIGSTPMPDLDLIIVAVVFGLVMPVAFMLLKLRIVVTDKQIDVGLHPFYKRRIPFGQIKRIKPADIQPLLEFGGRGIRWNGAKWGYILGGARGFELELEKGLPVVISTKDADKLSAVFGKYYGAVL